MVETVVETEEDEEEEKETEIGRLTEIAKGRGKETGRETEPERVERENSKAMKPDNN